MVDWDRRYREGAHGGATEPHRLLRRFWSHIPRGVVLDVAMGTGRDLFFLAGRGYRVLGVDRSREALTIARGRAPAGNPGVGLILGDAASLPIRRGSLEGIIVFYFLIRESLPELTGLLKEGGVLVYETFLGRQNHVDRKRNEAYLLDDGELFETLKSLETIFYEETLSIYEGKRRAIAQFVGRKR